MTLGEAIETCKEAAEIHTRESVRKDAMNQESSKLLHTEYARRYRQLTRWLTELQQYKSRDLYGEGYRNGYDKGYNDALNERWV